MMDPAEELYKLLLRYPVLTCQFCDGPATCFGVYENADQSAFACDQCCGHGNEDGRCVQLANTIQRSIAELRGLERGATQSALLEGLPLPRSVVARTEALEQALKELSSHALACCAALVRLPWVDDAPQDSVDRDSVVDIAMRLKTGCDIARAALRAETKEEP